MKFNTLKEKCEYYKNIADDRLMPNSYVIAHLDGRAFSKMIKKSFKQPFDDNFIFMMNETAKYLCSNVEGVKLAYVQSDEITLVLTDFDTETTDSWFGYRKCKLISTMAAMATAKFNRLWVEDIVQTPCSFDDMTAMLHDIPLITFDCKCWNVSSYNDTVAWLIYRQNDCIKNSVSQTAQSLFSHKELEGVNTQEKIDKMICEKGINWNDFDSFVKFGRFIRRIETKMKVEGVEEDVVRHKWAVEAAFKITDDKERFDNMNIIPKMQ